MHFASGLAWLSFFLLRALPVSAVYRDEAYKIDYQHGLLGAPVRDNTFFYQPTLSSKATLLYTLSEKNVVGAVNPKDGSVIWRQQLPSSPSCDADYSGVLGGANGTNMVVSAYGNKVMGWEAASGRLLWSFEELGCVQSLVVPDILDVTQDPVVLMNDNGAMRLTALNSINGKVIWQVTEDIGDLPLAVAASSTHIYYVALQPVKSKGYNVKVVSVDAPTAQPVGEEIISTASDITSVGSILHFAQRSADPMIVWTDKLRKNLKVNVLGTKDVTTLPLPKSSEPIEQIAFHAPNVPQAVSHFLISYQTASSHWAEVYNIDKVTKEVKKIHDLPKVDGPGTFSVSSIGVNVFFTRVSKNSVLLHFSSSPQVLESWDLSHRFKDMQEASEGISHIATEIVPRGMSNYALRAATTLTSGDWMLMRNGEVEWLRSESLAGIVAASWADTPAPDGLAKELETESHENLASAYFHRLTRHARELKYLPGWLSAIPQRLKRSFTGATSASAAELADIESFGFQKLVIVATEKGRMMALDTGASGQVIWSTKVTELQPDERWNVTDILTTGDSVIALADGGEAVTLDLTTGLIRDRKSSDPSANIAKMLPVSTASGTSVMIPVSADGSVTEIPAQAFAEQDYIVTRASTGDVLGWAISNGKAQKMWTFSAPEGEKIVSVSTRPAHDPVASIGRVLGDRNVLYKYLSPNLLLIMTINTAASTATVYLLDTVSGSSLYTTKHQDIDTTRPIAVTMSENWFVYTMFSTGSSRGFTLTMSDLYDSRLPNDRGSLEESANFSSVAGKAYLPYVMSTTYVLPTEISYLTTTSTKQGITPRSLLAYCPSLAAIMSIPVPMLSPRRPVGRDPTNAEREEGLFRYAPLFDVHPAWSISHARDVLGIRGMAVSPTLMESTSLVFAYGDLDVFGTRVAPIGSFDILGKGFGKIQLILTLVGLGVGTYFLAPMVRRRQVDTLWKS